MQDAHNDIVMTGVGMLTAQGVSVTEHWDKLTSAASQVTPNFSLADFKPAQHLNDRRMLKAVSPIDAIGLVAIDGLCRDMKYEAQQYRSERVGLYVGAPPASTYDNEPYVDAMRAAGCSIRTFGKTCMTARPTTLLVGLPNNVLCYGALRLDAKGPNSNYTSGMLSGHLAVLNAYRRLVRGQLDCAVAGGFSAHTEPVHTSMFQQLGLNMPLADGAVFVGLERRQEAAAHGRLARLTLCGGSHVSDACGPLNMDMKVSATERAINKAIAHAGVSLDEVGLVLAGAMGDKAFDASESVGLSRVFAKVRELPALGFFSPFLGQLMEAGGLAELALLPWLYERGELPLVLRHQDEALPFASRIERHKRIALILRGSSSGEASCLVVRANL